MNLGCQIDQPQSDLTEMRERVWKWHGTPQISKVCMLGGFIMQCLPTASNGIRFPPRVLVTESVRLHSGMVLVIPDN